MNIDQERKQFEQFIAENDLTKHTEELWPVWLAGVESREKWAAQEQVKKRK